MTYTPNFHLLAELRNGQRRCHALEVAKRAPEMCERNQRNLDRWRARSAWLDHNSLLGVLRDPRTDEARVRYEDRSELTQNLDGTFTRRWYFEGRFENEKIEPGKPDPKNWTGRFYVAAEIEAEYRCCDEEPKLMHARLQRGLTAGIGDAPGTAHIVG